MATGNAHTRSTRPWVAVVATLLAGLLVPHVAGAVTPDPRLDVDGIVTADFGAATSAQALAIQPDGKIVIVGYRFISSTERDWALARFNTDGTLDQTFGVGGKVTTDFAGNSDWPYAVGVLASGKIVVAGYAVNGATFDTAVARYNPNGTLDTTFDFDGRVLIDVSGALGAAGSNDQASDMALQADGRIVLTGWTEPSGSYDYAYVARLGVDGAVDTTFSGDGFAFSGTLTTYTKARAVAVQSDGKIVMLAERLEAPLEYNFVATRLLANGSTDSSFGTGGSTTVDFGVFDSPADMVVRSDGKIYLVGKTGTIYAELTIARLTSAGQLDSSFNSTGKKQVAHGDSLSGDGVVLNADGSATIVGFTDSGDVRRTALVRVNDLGGLDTTFDSDGIYTVDLAPGHNEFPTGIAKQQNNKLVVPAFIGSGTVDKIALVRFAGSDIGAPIPVVPRKGGLTAAKIATYADMIVPKGAKVSLTVAPASKKTCGLKSSKLVSKKAGTCRVTVTVKPKKGKTQKATAVLTAK